MNNFLDLHDKKLLLSAALAFVLTVLIEWLLFSFFHNLNALDYVSNRQWGYMLVSLSSIVIYILLTVGFIKLLHLGTGEVLQPKRDAHLNENHVLAIHNELVSAKPYIDIMIKQIDGVLIDTESGVLVAIDKINQLDASYQRQLLGNVLVDVHQSSESLTILTDLLGSLQFQDVVRQRLEQVKSALQQLECHLDDLDKHLMNERWDGVLADSLKAKIDKIANEYVMQSQYEAHLKVSEIEIKNSINQSIVLF